VCFLIIPWEKWGRFANGLRISINNIFQIKNNPCFSIGGCWSFYFVLTKHDVSMFLSRLSSVRHHQTSFSLEHNKEKAGGERISQPLVNDGERERTDSAAALPALTLELLRPVN
jgi:hypothetical protein